MQRTWVASLSLATAVMLMSALPALSQSVSGSEGDASATPSTTPLPATIAFPPVENATTRDISLDSPPTAAGLATMTKLADGTESSTPASAALIASVTSTIGSVLAGAPLKTIIGIPAPLVPVGNAGVYPYRAVGLIEVTYGPNTYPCTGTLIGPSTVITAAGCLWGAESNPVWADKVTFSPGAQNGSAPYDVIPWAEGHVMQEYADAATATASSYGSSPYDVGVVILSKPVGTKLGWFGFETDPNKTYTPKALAYGESGQEPALASTTCPVDAASMSRSSATAAPCIAGNFGTPYFVADSKGALFITGMGALAPNDGTAARVIARMSAVTYQWIADLRK